METFIYDALACLLLLGPELPLENNAEGYSDEGITKLCESLERQVVSLGFAEEQPWISRCYLGNAISEIRQWPAAAERFRFPGPEECEAAYLHNRTQRDWLSAQHDIYGTCASQLDELDRIHTIWSHLRYAHRYPSERNHYLYLLKDALSEDDWKAGRLPHFILIFE